MFGKDSYIENDGLRGVVRQESNRVWIRRVGYGNLHVVANIYSFDQHLRDACAQQVSETTIHSRKDTNAHTTRGCASRDQPAN